MTGAAPTVRTVVPLPPPVPRDVFALINSTSWLNNGINLLLVDPNQKPESLVILKVCARVSETELSASQVCEKGLELHDFHWRTTLGQPQTLHIGLGELPGSIRSELSGPWRWIKVVKLRLVIYYMDPADPSRLERDTSVMLVEVTSRTRTVLMAAAIVFLFLFGAGYLVRAVKLPDEGGESKHGRGGRGKKGDHSDDRFRRRGGPFNYIPMLLRNQLGNYSLSMTQVLLWTCTTLFGFVYIWLMGEGIPEIPSQMLMLLGIGGGTALLSRVNSRERNSVSWRYIALVKNERDGSLADLISVDGQPSLFKFQMLCFTLVTVGIVIGEVCTKSAFAQISDSLVTLMGISSAAYLGNDRVQVQVWVGVRKKIALIEELAKPLKQSGEWTDAKIVLRLCPTSDWSDDALIEAYPVLSGHIAELHDLLLSIYSDGGTSAPELPSESLSDSSIVAIQPNVTVLTAPAPASPPQNVPPPIPPPPAKP